MASVPMLKQRLIHHKQDSSTPILSSRSRDTISRQLKDIHSSHPIRIHRLRRILELIHIKRQREGQILMGKDPINEILCDLLG